LQLTAKRNMHDTCALTNKKKKKIYLYIGNSNHSMLSRTKEREENSNTFFFIMFLSNKYVMLFTEKSKFNAFFDIV